MSIEKDQSEIIKKIQGEVKEQLEKAFKEQEKYLADYEKRKSLVDKGAPYKDTRPEGFYLKIPYVKTPYIKIPYVKNPYLKIPYVKIGWFY